MAPWSDFLPSPIFCFVLSNLLFAWVVLIVSQLPLISCSSSIFWWKGKAFLLLYKPTIEIVFISYSKSQNMFLSGPPVSSSSRYSCKVYKLTCFCMKLNDLFVPFFKTKNCSALLLSGNRWLNGCGWSGIRVCVIFGRLCSRFEHLPVAISNSLHLFRTNDDNDEPHPVSPLLLLMMMLSPSLLDSHPVRVFGDEEDASVDNINEVWPAPALSALCRVDGVENGAVWREYSSYGGLSVAADWQPAAVKLRREREILMIKQKGMQWWRWVSGDAAPTEILLLKLCGTLVWGL